MISADELKKTAKNLLGSSNISPDVNWNKIADQLKEHEQESAIELTSYGFFMWAIEHYGASALFKNLLASEKLTRGYAECAASMRDDMPSLLYNAHIYVSKLMGNVSDIGVCFKHLEGMTFPYVLYVLFTGSGQEDVVQSYKTSLIEVLKRYPSTLDKLPESYRNVGKEILNADAE